MVYWEKIAAVSFVTPNILQHTQAEDGYRLDECGWCWATNGAYIKTY